MKTRSLTIASVMSATIFFSLAIHAQTSASVVSTPPVTLEEKEAMYNTAIEYRVQGIMEALALTNATQSNAVYNIIVAQYHALRARDEAIDAELSDLPRGSHQWLAERNAMFPAMSRPLHDRFIARLSKELTPAQVVKVKDGMTYGKVAFTYNAYCEIIPNLTDEEKTKIMELLEQAREVAMDGGSSGEKSDIFQSYKDQINRYLKAQGIDADKAIREWSERQKTAEKSSNLKTN